MATMIAASESAASEFTNTISKSLTLCKDNVLVIAYTQVRYANIGSAIYQYISHTGILKCSSDMVSCSENMCIIPALNE